jgi:hypothetical protein
MAERCLPGNWTWERLKLAMLANETKSYQELEREFDIDIPTLNEAYDEAFEEHRETNRQAYIAKYGDKYDNYRAPELSKADLRIQAYVGRRFGCWTVIGEGETVFSKTSAGGIRTMRRVRCRCICGKERDIAPCSLEAGRTKSCGCQRNSGRKKHGNK